MSTIWDTIVVGVGGMGGAALFECARRGWRVLGLERHAMGHDRGSSHGQTRIIRKAYYEHPAYVPLLHRAYERWYDLEQRIGKHLLTECGVLSVGLPTSELLQGVETSANTHALPIEKFDADELRLRYPMFRFGPEYAGILERSGGFLAVDDCVRGYVDAARQLGATVHESETVFGWQATSREVIVRTDRGTYHAARLILTAGSWLGELLSDWGVPLTVMRQVPMWFGVEFPEQFRRDRMPCWIADTPAGMFYGFPMLDPLGVKIAEHYGAVEVGHPSEIDRQVHAADEERLWHFLTPHLPGVVGPRHRATVCTYTLTPDRHFLIDRHPEYDNVCIAGGFSGHGYKFASVVGEILADLVEHGRTSWPIDMFRWGRWTASSVD